MKHQIQDSVVCTTEGGTSLSGSPKQQRDRSYFAVLLCQFCDREDRGILGVEIKGKERTKLWFLSVGSS